MANTDEYITAQSGKPLIFWQNTTLLTVITILADVTDRGLTAV